MVRYLVTPTIAGISKGDQTREGQEGRAGQQREGERREVERRRGEAL